MWPITPARQVSSWFFCVTWLATAALAADEAPGPDSALVKLLKSGRVPAERQGTVVEMIGKRGNVDDLGFLLEKAIAPDGFTPANRLRAVDALAEAAHTRNLRPAGDLARLSPLIAGKDADPAVKLAAVRLAGLWKAEALGGALRSIAAAPESTGPLRAAALDALAAIGGKEGRASIEALAGPDRPVAVRAQAVAALARLDVHAAAERAVAVLRDAGKGHDDLTGMVAAFLNRRDGADALASALGRAALPADSARLALRAVYALGRSDPGLVAALTKATGIDAEVKPLEKADMDRLIAAVAAQGNPARGEAVFRRADLNCAKCHALSGAGGGVGPDLSSVGSSSPVDYLINSIMLPDQAIKEEFRTLVAVTTDGQTFQGIVADRDDKRIILREATGELRTIPAAAVEESKEGGSLMPKGLVNFLTRAEFVDLVRFLSELGKPGPYAVRASPTVQRWRSLKPVDDELTKQVPSEASFRTFALEADPAHWLPAYARTAGALPLAEVAGEAGSKVLYLQAEVEVSLGGKVDLALDASDGVTAWVDDRPAPAFTGAKVTTELASGRHKLTFRVDTAARKEPTLRVEVLKPAGSAVEYAVVGGR